jgi:predicted nucleic acid-binding protein
LVLDANALNERGLLHFLAEYSGRKVLPAVAAAEVFYHLKVQRGWGPAEFYQMLRDSDIVIEPLDAHKALAAADLGGERFVHAKADCLIGAHALAPGRVLLTNNVRDFPEVARKETPGERMRRPPPR